MGLGVSRIFSRVCREWPRISLLISLAPRSLHALCARQLACLAACLADNRLLTLYCRDPCERAAPDKPCPIARQERRQPLPPPNRTRTKMPTRPTTIPLITIRHPAPRNES